MLILLTILILTAAASAFIYFFNKNNSERQLDSGVIGSLSETTHFRPLFEPSDEEMLAELLAAGRQTKLDDERRDDDFTRKRLAEFRNRLRAWKTSPNVTEIGELLELAGADGESFSVTAEAITKEFLNGRIDRISSGDLARMLESHFWLLPAERREPAVSFRVKEAIREIRENGAKAPIV